MSGAGERSAQRLLSPRIPLPGQPTPSPLLPNLPLSYPICRLGASGSGFHTNTHAYDLSAAQQPRLTKIFQLGNFRCSPNFFYLRFSFSPPRNHARRFIIVGRIVITCCDVVARKRKKRHFSERRAGDVGSRSISALSLSTHQLLRGPGATARRLFQVLV